MSAKQLTLEEKVKIVQEAEQNGFTEVALKYNISSRQIYRWRDKLQGIEHQNSQYPSQDCF